MLNRLFYLLVLTLPLSMSAKIVVTGSSAILRPDEGILSHVYQVANRGEESASVNIAIFKSEYTVDGEEQLIANDEIEDSFMIFPPHMQIPPGKKRGLKVTYLGHRPDSEIAYRVIFEEIPDLEISSNTMREHTQLVQENQVGVFLNIYFKYVTRLWLELDNVSQNMQCIGLERVQKNDAEHLRMLFKNTGKGYATYDAPILQIILNSGEILQLDTKEIRDSIAGKTILPNTTRAFYIPWQNDWTSLNSIKTAKIEEGL